MKFLPIIQVEITDTVSELIAVCYNRALSGQNSNSREVLKKGIYTAILQIKDNIAYCLIISLDRGIITHPRSGEVKLFGYPTTIGTKMPTYELGHMGIGYTKQDSSFITSGDTIDNTTGLPFPLINAEEYACLFSNDYLEDSNWTFSGIEEVVYGNVDWKSSKEDEEDRRILTYTGNPSRYWPVDYYINIPDLSKIDHVVESDLDSYAFMTVFSEFVYESGSILAEMPAIYAPSNSPIQKAQVLGAAIRSLDNKLVCAVKTCYNSYPREKAIGELVSTWQVWQNGFLIQDWLEDETGARQQASLLSGGSVVEVTDPGRGYFVEILLQTTGDIAGGWKRLLRIPTGTNMPNCNFFFSTNGAKCCSVMFDKLYIVSIGETSATYVETSVGTFKQSITTTKSTQSDSTPWGEGDNAPAPGDWKNYSQTTRTYNQIKSGSKIIAADYKENELTTMTATISGGNVYSKTKAFGTKWGQTARVPELTEASDRIPYLIFGYCDGGGGPGTVSFVATAMGSCDPLIQINGITVNSGECTVFTIPDCTEDTVLYPVTATLVDRVTGLGATFEGEAQVTTGATWTYVAGTGTCGDVGFCSFYPSGQPYNCSVSAAINHPSFAVPIPDDYTTEYISDTRRKRRETSTWISSLTNSGLCVLGTYDFRSRWTDYVIVGTVADASCTETVYYGYLASCWWEEELICP